jgi:hypothetical protein
LLFSIIDLFDPLFFLRCRPRFRPFSAPPFCMPTCLLRPPVVHVSSCQPISVFLHLHPSLSPLPPFPPPTCPALSLCRSGLWLRHTAAGDGGWHCLHRRGSQVAP